MKPRDIAALLRRAAAGLETPEDLSHDEHNDLIVDLLDAAESIRPAEDDPACSCVEPGCPVCDLDGMA